MRRDKEDETEIMYYKLIFRHIPALQKFADISTEHTQNFMGHVTSFHTIDSRIIRHLRMIDNL